MTFSSSPVDGLTLRKPTQRSCRVSRNIVMPLSSVYMQQLHLKDNRQRYTNIMKAIHFSFNEKYDASLDCSVDQCFPVHVSTNTVRLVDP